MYVCMYVAFMFIRPAPDSTMFELNKTFCAWINTILDLQKDQALADFFEKDEGGHDCHISN